MVHKQTESGFYHYPGAKVLFKRRKKPPQWACITTRARLSPTTKAASPLDDGGRHTSRVLLWGSAQQGAPRKPCNTSSSTSRAACRATCKLLHSPCWDQVGWEAGNLQTLPKHTLPRLLPLSLRKPIDMSTKPVCHLQPTLYFLFHADSSFDKTT